MNRFYIFLFVIKNKVAQPPGSPFVFDSVSVFSGVALPPELGSNN